MADGYHHLTYGSRCQIYALKRSGMSVRGVSRALEVSASTVSRELRRNRGLRGYQMKQAQRFSEVRRRQASSRPRKLTEGLWSRIEEQLRRQWSPQQIAGRLRLQGGPLVGKTWIYRQVWQDRANGGTLYRNLRRRGKKANRRGRSGAGRGVIPGRVDIAERPAVVELKRRVGDWELDTIIGARGRGALVSMVDRCSKFVFLQRVAHRTSLAVGGAILARLGPLSALARTLTADNGKEFAGHRAIAAGLSAGFFFARPYHSWERGLNEHTNGLVRQYLPKAMDFTGLGDARVRRVQDLLNGRPRRVLGYRTPAEVFGEALDAACIPAAVVGSPALAGPDPPCVSAALG